MPRPRAFAIRCLIVLSALALVLSASPASAQQETFDSGVIDPGDQWSSTFDTPGEYPYHCHMHPGKEGTLVVHEPDEDHEPQEHTVRIVEPTPVQQSWYMDPQRVEIQAGDTVIWVNEGDEPHNVHTNAGGAAEPHEDQEGSMEDGMQDDEADDEMTDEGMESGENGENGDMEDQDTPGPPMIGLLLALAAFLLIRRR